MRTRREYWEQRIGSAETFRTRDVARICDVSPRQVRRWIQMGRLLALGSAGASTYDARIPREALLDFLIKRTPPSEYPFLQGSLF